MPKKELGSVTRTAGAFAAGIVLSKALQDYGLTYELLESMLNTIEYIIAVLGLITVQGWSLVNHHKKAGKIKILEKKVNAYENLNT
ncbi:MAG: hypothetical protein COB09_19085 [Thalassobium sp.]|nr:MAG: hypothetical protein COB09_19085 [Thalassobium sp.]